MQDLEKSKYPIGKYEPPKDFTLEQINLWIADLAALPQQIADLTANLDENALAKVYRPDGWTVKQVIHHLADSHINAYTRVKLTLTEESPTIRPYFEDRWAILPDGKDGNIKLSIAILKAVHERLVLLLRSLAARNFERTYFHPEAKQQFSLAYLVGNYAWHGKHHLAHIKSTFK